MEQRVKDHLIQYNLDNGYGTTDADLIESVTEGKQVYKKELSGSRWWSNVYRVVEVAGMYIGYTDAVTTGDDSPEDKGWEFDPNTIQEVEKKIEVQEVVSYIPIKN